MPKPSTKSVVNRLLSLDDAAVGFLRRLPTQGQRLLPVSATLLVFVLSAAGLVAYQRSQFNMLVYADAVDNAQIARNLAEGRGFTTSSLRPSSLSLNPKLDRPPELRRPPLGPLTEAFFFLSRKPTDRVASYYSCCFFLLTLLSTWRFAVAVFGWQTACLGTLALALNQSLLGAAISGMPLTLASWLFVLLCHGLWKHHERFCERQDPDLAQPRAGERARHAFWTGVLLGLCCLTYYVFLAAVPVALVYIAVLHPKRRRLVPTALFLCGFLLCFGPLLARNWRATGAVGLGVAPMELSMFTEYAPEYTRHRQFGTARSTGVGFVVEHPKAVVRKLIREGLSLYDRVPALPTATLFGLFLVSLFYREEGQRSYRAVRQFVCWTFALMCLTVCAVHANPQLFVLFVPVVIVGAVQFLRDLCASVLSGTSLGRWPIPQAHQGAAVTLAILLLAAAPSLVAVFVGVPPEPNPSKPDFALIGTHCGKGDLIVTDVPWSVAWYAQRTALWMPVDPETLEKDAPRAGGDRWLYLSRMFPTYPSSEVAPWAAAYFQREPRGSLQAPVNLPSGGVLYRLK